jgi:hypothetical protein
VVAKVRERLAVSEQAVQNFNVEKFSFRKLNGLKVKKVSDKVSNRVAGLENLNDSKDMHTVWENIKENIKISTKEILCLCELK